MNFNVKRGMVIQMTHNQLYNVYIASCDKEGGVCRYNLNENGEMLYVDKVDLDRPMYLTVNKNVLYALLREPFDNSKESGVAEFEISNDGNLIKNEIMQSTKGEVGCHLSVDENIYCVNYISGSVIKIPDKLVIHSGKSIHPIRQTSPHTHQVVFTPDNKYVCVVDLGLDKILIYDKDLNYVSDANVPQGHGARHIVFSPDGKYSFCANELKSTVSVFAYYDGKLILGETYTILPDDYQGESTVAAIRISSDGKYLYVSNRGHDSIACFEVEDGILNLFGLVDCGGNSPRDFNITPNGRFLVCTNENSDNVTIFEVNDGKLLKTKFEVEVKNPLCVVFDEVKKCVI